MNYKSKLRIPIQLHEASYQKIQEELAVLQQQKENIMRDIEKEKERGSEWRNQLQSGSLSSSFFSQVDYRYIEQKEREKEQVMQEMEQKTVEFLQIKNKLERLKEIDQNREKEFNKEKEKKEEKRLHDLNQLKRHFKGR